MEAQRRQASSARVAARVENDINIDVLQQQIARVESVLILLTIAAIAAADYFVGRQNSLGPLYLIPLSYAALTHRWTTMIALFAVCLTLRQWFGPIQASSDPWFFFFRDLVIAAFFVATVGYLHRLGLRRKSFFDLARRQRDDLSREVELAAGLQRRLLDLSDAPEGRLDIAARMEPLKGVGGDYYDFLDLENGRTGIVIADVAGKGLPAALLMPAVRIALRSIVQRQRDPERILDELNDVVCQTTETSNYATLLYASVDHASGSMRYANAGHVPGMVVGPGDAIQWLDEGGMPVGLVPEAEYQSAALTLEPGAAFVLCSDGVTEAESRDGEEMGTDGLARIVQTHLAESAEGIVSAVLAELRRFQGSAPTDDTTVIVIKRLPDASS